MGYLYLKTASIQEKMRCSSLSFFFLLSFFDQAHSGGACVVLWLPEGFV